MLLIDDILMSPCKGLLWVFQEIHKNAAEELDGEAERIRDELTDLYMMLKTEQIAEDEFDRREAALLDRLDQLEAQGYGDADEEDDADADRADADTLADVGAEQRRLADVADAVREPELHHALASEE
jgi:hypothetical protein